ncbi:alpha/beta-hydrolase [Aspergillus insuetus]
MATSNSPSVGQGNKISQRFPDAVFQKLTYPKDHPLYRYKEFQQSTTVLPSGHCCFPGSRKFGVEVYFDRNVSIVVRDGITLYADVFRPVTSDTVPVPVIIPWSAYGKTGTGPQTYDFMAPFRAAIPVGRTSGYEKFEAPDPAEWCERGYAVLNIDARGAGDSEGDISFWGDQEAEDIYDVIEWLTKQPWCNGSIAMAGNSWLAISQVNFASRLSHPALKALAPWESYTDLYRQVVARGGRPHLEKFHKLIIGGFAGNMLAKRPLYDDYWEAKRIPVERIGDIPIYIVGSYSTSIHLLGSLDTYDNAQSRRKWLRIHPYNEWYDFYRLEISDELQRYFDYYCKGIDNGWEEVTPPVRLSLLGFEGSPAGTVVERAEQEFPLARQVLRTYYLDARTRRLEESPVDEDASVSYDGHSLSATTDFTLYFSEATEICGYSKVKLWMSCNDHDDFDVAVQIRKIGADGNLMEQLNYPCPVSVNEVADVNVAKYLGPQGFLRASHAVSVDKSTEDSVRVEYRHDGREPVAPGKIVPLQITLWPMGMVFAPGEGIMLHISGHDMGLPEVESLRAASPEDQNVGRHNLFTGDEHDSFLLLPIIPSQ